MYSHRSGKKLLLILNRMVPFFPNGGTTMIPGSNNAAEAAQATSDLKVLAHVSDISSWLTTHVLKAYTQHTYYYKAHYFRGFCVLLTYYYFYPWDL